MAKSIADMPAFDPVATNQTARCKLPRNRRYHWLELQFKTNDSQANIQSAITQIRILINSKVVRTFSATQLFTILATNARAFSLGMIPIHFAEPWRATPEGREFLALNAFELLGVGDVEIQVDISGAIANPTLTGRMCFDYERPADVWADVKLPDGSWVVSGVSDAVRNAAWIKRTFMHWVPRGVPCNAAFTADMPLTPADFIPAVNGWLHRVHSFDAVVTATQVRTAETPFFKANTVQVAQDLINYGLAKQANVFPTVIDFTQQYDDGIYIPSITDLKFDFVTSGAATGNNIANIIEVRKRIELAA